MVWEQKNTDGSKPDPFLNDVVMGIEVDTPSEELYQKESWSNQLLQLFNAHKNQKQSLGILVIKLTNFQELTYKHTPFSIDQIHQKIQKRLVASSRDIDLIHNTRDDEILVFLPRAEERIATIAARRIHMALTRQAICLGWERLRFDVSIAVTTLQAKDSTLQDLYERACRKRHRLENHW